MTNAEIAAKLVDAMYWHLNGMRGIASGSDAVVRESGSALNAIVVELQTSRQPTSEPQQEDRTCGQCVGFGPIQKVQDRNADPKDYTYDCLKGRVPWVRFNDHIVANDCSAFEPRQSQVPPESAKLRFACTKEEFLDGMREGLRQGQDAEQENPNAST